MTPKTLNIALRNNTGSATVYAYVTGRALDNNSALFLLSADGRTPYYPSSPSKTIQPLERDTAIPLGAPGSTKTITIPRLAGSRVYYVIGGRLNFYLNPGPGLVEPSILNPSDSNAQKNFGFVELTFNDAQLFANISYVDFVSIPVALTLNTASNHTQTVTGMNPNGLDQVCNALRAQDAKDGAGWSKLIVQSNGRNLRALSPNSGIAMNGALFANYFAAYTAQVWQRYTAQPLKINTQAQWGVVQGRVSNGKLVIGGQTFGQPAARDIFSCSTGPFAENGVLERSAIIPRLAAAFNRSTLLLTDLQPDGGKVSQYYQASPTNHYSRIVHEVNLDHRGYAFPYDDVAADGTQDQSGSVFAGDPTLLTITIS